jgi:hypothetical protein
LLTTNPEINFGLLSAFLPITFFDDFKITTTGIECHFNQEVEKILPLITSFLEALKHVTMKNFYFDMQTKKIGILKIYDAEPLSFNTEFIFQEILCDYIKHELNK